MATVTEGNPVTLDALFGQGSQPSPDAVEFNVEQPDQTVLMFTFGVDANVANPAASRARCPVASFPEMEKTLTGEPAGAYLAAWMESARSGCPLNAARVSR